MRERLNILIHGEPKSGKTTFAVRRNPGVLVLDTEGSSKFVRGIERRSLTSLKQMDAVLAEIRAGKVNTIVIDTLDELVNNFTKNEAVSLGGDYVNKLGLLTVAGWGYMRDRFMKLTRAYRDAGADVLTICHSELVEKPDGSKKWAMKLPSDYAREVMGMQDVVGFIEAVKTTEGTVRRCHFDKTQMFDAGCRAIYDAASDKFFSPLPPLIEDCAFVDVLKAYDDFFDGTTDGFSVKCENCAKKGVEADAKEELDGMRLCADCAARYKELNKK